MASSSWVYKGGGGGGGGSCLTTQFQLFTKQKTDYLLLRTKNTSTKCPLLTLVVNEVIHHEETLPDFSSPCLHTATD